MVAESFGFECEACGTRDEGWDDYGSALRAEIAHLEKCGDPGAAECLAETRERLAKLTGGAGDADRERHDPECPGCESCRTITGPIVDWEPWE
jgi:hypothetical protein